MSTTFNYRKYYQTEYNRRYEGAMYSPLVLDSKTEVHHIRPKEFGGTHDYSNLIHLPEAFHRKISNWFAGY